MPVTASSIDHTLLITIDRPPVNALDIDMFTGLEQTFAAGVGSSIMHDLFGRPLHAFYGSCFRG